jgi:hypothetical protein
MKQTIFTAITITGFLLITSCTKNICHYCTEAYEYDGTQTAANSDYCRPESNPSFAQAFEESGREYSCLSAGGAWTLRQ